jgi:hypothetical protein
MKTRKVPLDPLVSRRFPGSRTPANSITNAQDADAPTAVSVSGPE